MTGPDQGTGPRFMHRSKLLAFAQEAAASDSVECLLWPFTTTEAGYGIVRTRKPSGTGWTTTTAHRLVLELAAGPPPCRTHHAAHDPKACTSPSCVNPRHLRWATPAENTADQIVDGTRPYGWLSPADVRAIRASSDSRAALAAKYGVSGTAISLARSGKNHAHVL